MSNDNEKREREERAARLVQARKAAGLGGAKRLSDRFGWNPNTYKAHESARNGFGISDAKAYARAFNVSLPWLYFGAGSPKDPFIETGELQKEVIELFDELPPKMQDVELDHLRRLVRALRGEGEEDPHKAT